VSVTYTLRYRPVAAEGSAPGEWTEVAGLTGTSHALTGLSAGVRYEVEVEAVSSAGVRSSALVAQRSTVCVAPAQPSVLPAGYVLSSGDPGTNGRLAASWGAVTGAQSYRVRHRTAAVGGTAAGEWVEASGIVGTSQDTAGLDGSVSYDVEVAAVNVDGDVSDWSTTRSGVPARIASGGTVTTFAGNGATDSTLTNIEGETYVVHTFTDVGSSTFALNRASDVEYLIVAGGGGGGSRHGGGGGAGGMRSGTVEGAAVNVEGYPVVVGAGGAGVAAHNNSAPFPAPSSGSPSSVLGVDAVGGGTGGNSGGPSGGSGGSGGGSSNGSASPGSATVLQGNIGGQGSGAPGTPYLGAGGGGAGSSGVAPNTSTGVAGAGGSGRATVIAGNSPVTYAGGGGGGGGSSSQSPGAAGADGGGAGGFGGGAGGNATSGSGGGGGGGSFDDGQNPQNKKGGDGGSGRVIVRYRLPA
jgi:hypothetical protein